MAVRLEIKKGDGTSYWTEHFDAREIGEKWLAEEKTRPYWKQEYTHQFIDIPSSPPIVPNPVEVALRRAAIDRIRAANVDGVSTLAALRDLLKDILIVNGLK